MHKWRRLVCALGVFVFFCGFTGQSVRADGSVSSSNMGYGAANLEEFRYFQSVYGSITHQASAFASTHTVNPPARCSFPYEMSVSSQARSCCFTLAATGEKVLSALPSRKYCSARINLPCASTSRPTITWIRWTFTRYPAARSSAASATGHAGRQIDL